MPNITDKLREALMASTATLAERGLARFKRDLPSVPKGWACHGGTFTRLHDRDLRAFITIKDDAADKDLFDAIPPEVMAQLREATGNPNSRSDPRPLTYHVSISRNERPVSEADIQLVARTFVPSVAAWDKRITRSSPSPHDRQKTRSFVHLFAPVPPRTDAN